MRGPSRSLPLPMVISTQMKSSVGRFQKLGRGAPTLRSRTTRPKHGLVPLRYNESIAELTLRVSQFESTTGHSYISGQNSLAVK